MTMTTSASNRPTLRRWTSWVTLASLLVAQATLFGAVAADGSTTGSESGPAAYPKLESVSGPADSSLDPFGTSPQADPGPWSLIGDRRAATCQSPVASNLVDPAKGDLPIVAPSAPGLWRQELKSRPAWSNLERDAGRVISPTGPVNLDVDPRGRWVTGYRPNTPQAQAQYDRWKNEQRLTRLEGKDTGRKSRDGGPQGNLFPSRNGYESVAGDLAESYVVRDEKAPVSQIDPRQVDAVPETPRERNIDPNGLHRLSGLTWQEYVQVKLMADVLPETPDAQIATENRAPSGFGVSFDAIANTAGGTPPDPIMTAGPNDLIAIVNSRYRVFDKTGSPRGIEITTNTLFAGISECQGAFDVFADYDEEYDRFVLGAMTLTNGGNDSYLCVAASATNDPAGAWNRTSFRSDAVVTSLSGDYPHMGIGLDAIYIAQNMFVDAGGFDHVRVYAVDKFDLYAGTPAEVAEAGLNQAYFTGQPVKLHGYSSGGWPAPGTPHHIIASDGFGQTRIWRWINPFVQGPTVYGTVTGLAYGGVPPLAPELDDVGDDENDTGSGAWFDAEYRDGKLWATRGVACNIGGGLSEACVDWIQVDVSGGSPVLEQQQTGGAYGSADDFRYYPDVSVDRNNNIAIGYTKSSTTTYTELWVTGREFGDTAGTLQAETLQKAGTGNYTDGAGCGGTCDRFGDYSGMVVDPDGCTFWYLGEYSNGGNLAWRTHIGSYMFDSCSVDSTVKLDQSTYTCGGNLTVTVQDSIAISAASVSAQTVVTTSSGDSETIPAGSWSGSDCVGSECGTWVAIVPISGDAGSSDDGVVNVADGGTITTDYIDPHVGDGHVDQSRTAAVNCTTQFDDGGFLIDGGCELGAGTERYRDYLDGGEYIAYSFGAFNPVSASALTDVYATLSITGPAADKVTIYNPTIYIGNVAQASLTAPVFNLYIDPSIDTAGLRMSEHDFDLSITSPADGYTVPQVLTQLQVLQAEDNIETLSECFNFEGSDQGFIQDGYVASWPCDTCSPSGTVNTVAATWTWGTGCGSETRTDYPDCAAAGTSAFKTNSGAATCGTFAQATYQATDDIIYSPIFNPTYTGDAGTNQPWQYRWTSAEYFYRSDMVNAAGDTAAMAWGHFFSNDYQGTATPAENEVDTEYAFFSGFGVLANQEWDSATAWDPDNPPANFGGLSFSSDASGPATSGMQWRWAVEAYDADWGGNPLDTEATQGIAIDNMTLNYDQYHVAGQVGTCDTAPATLSFDQFSYQECSSGTLTITVLDGNATGPLTVTVTSEGGGDSETVIIPGPGPDFTTTLAYDTASGVADDDGTLLVTPEDTVLASYDDADPVATVTAGAFVVCNSGDVIVDSVAGLQDNGDGDDYADTNELVNLSIRLKNNTQSDLTNAVAVIATDDPNIECVTKDSAGFGTLAADGGTASNDLLSDPFTFKVANTAVCGDPQSPPTATFQVFILADGFSGPSAPQSFTLTLDLNDLPGTATFVEDFTTEPTTFYHELGPGDDDGIPTDPNDYTCSPYVDLFHWNATGGNSGGGYFCWEDPADSFPNGDYNDLNDSALYSPTFKIGATTTTLSFDHEYQFASNATLLVDGARVDYRLNGGAWQKLQGPAYDGPLIHNFYCNPLCNGGWNTPCFSENSADPDGEDIFCLFNFATQNWTNDSFTLSGLTVGDQVQFRWRVGSMSTSFYGLTTTGGYGLDNVSVTNTLAQECDTADNPDEGCGVAFDSAGNLIEICGDGDLVVEPTEIWSVDVTLKNAGSSDAVNTVADLAVNAGSGALATVSGNPGSYGTISGGGGTASATYGFTVDAGAVCVNDIVFDVTNISDLAQSYPDDLSAFSVQVGALAAGETANQLADPLTAVSGSSNTPLAPDFTLAAPVDMATLDYSFDYSNSAASETATQDTDPLVAANNLTQVSTLSSAFTITAGDASSASVDWSSLTAVGTPGNVTDCARVFLRTPNLTDIDLKSFGVAAANPYDVTSIYQGANGGPGQYSIGVQEQGGQCKVSLTLGATSMSVVGAVGTGTWTANARVSLNDGTSWHVLKEYGVADASPYDVTSIYNAAGPGTYQIRVGENGGGGTASLSSGSMSISSVECDLGCSALPPAPPLADGVTGTAMTVDKGVSDDDLVFTIDNATCSSDHAVVLYGNLGDFSGYQGAVDTGCDIGSGPTGNAFHAGDNVWFQVIWVNADDAAGHPGWATSGARGWNATGLCAVASDDSSDEVCN